MIPYLCWTNSSGMVLRKPLLQSSCGHPIVPSTGAIVIPRDGVGKFRVKEIVYDYSNSSAHVQVWAERVE